MRNLLFIVFIVVVTTMLVAPNMVFGHSDAEYQDVYTGWSYFDGQDKLAKTVRDTVGGFHGRIAVWETIDDHAHRMHDIIAASGIPEGNIDMVSAYNPLSILSLSKFRVVNSSTTWTCNPHPLEIQLIRMMPSTLFVTAAGNIPQYGVTDRDVYKPENPMYTDKNPVQPWSYQNTMRLLNTGKVIIATIVTVDKGFYPFDNAAKCGNAKEYCFTVPLDFWTAREIGTSGATARLSALAFHLAQLYGTPEEIIDVLRKTATDIGEPGVDEEFGWGVPNVNHPIILERSREKVFESLLLVKKDDETLSRMNGAAEGFSSFITKEGGSGIVYSNERSKLLFCTSKTATPFGIQSSFMDTAGTCTRLAAQQTFLKLKNHHLAAIGTYGYASSDDWLVRNGRVGLHYNANPKTNLNLAFYAGYRQVWGSIGIPGYAEVGNTKTPFKKSLIEVRTSIKMNF